MEVENTGVTAVYTLKDGQKVQFCWTKGATTPFEITWKKDTVRGRACLGTLAEVTKFFLDSFGEYPDALPLLPPSALDPDGHEVCGEIEQRRTTSLTDKEFEVLRYRANDWMLKQISYELGVSGRAISERWASARKKLGSVTSAGTIGEAFRLGILTVDDIAAPEEANE